MANPNIPTLEADIRYEDRGGCFVLVDPVRPEGLRDIATAWEETRDRWRWRLNDDDRTGTPYPTASYRDRALEDMLTAYTATDREIAERLTEQRPRFSFGQPQIFRA